jgi:hypothetical protein
MRPTMRSRLFARCHPLRTRTTQTPKFNAVVHKNKLAASPSAAAAPAGRHRLHSRTRTRLSSLPAARLRARILSPVCAWRVATTLGLGLLTMDAVRRTTSKSTILRSTRARRSCCPPRRIRPSSSSNTLRAKADAELPPTDNSVVEGRALHRCPSQRCTAPHDTAQNTRARTHAHTRTQAPCDVGPTLAAAVYALSVSRVCSGDARSQSPSGSLDANRPLLRSPSAKKAKRVLRETHAVRAIAIHPGGQFMLGATDHMMIRM